MKSDSILGVYDAYKHDLREINLGKVKRGEIDVYKRQLPKAAGQALPDETQHGVAEVQKLRDE